MTWEEYQYLTSRAMRADQPPAQISPGVPAVKPKRKVSKYNRTYAKEYRIHRAKHPRMSHAQITKLAHKATKKVLK